MTQVAFSRPPSYQWWMNEDSEGTQLFSNSPRTYIELPMNYSRMPAGKVYAMQVTSFNIDQPPSGEGRGSWDGEGSTAEETHVGKLVFSPDTSSGGDTPCFTSLSQNAMNGTWYHDQNTITVMGTFMGETGENFQSTPILITAPVNDQAMGLFLVGGKSSGFLVNRTQSTGAVAALDGWSCCVSYWTLTDTEIKAFCPYNSNRYTSLPLTIYPDVVQPTPPLVTLSGYTEAETPKAATPAWVGLDKTPGGTIAYWLNLGSVYLNNTNATTYQLVADFYNDITDSTAADPAVAFSAESPAYTTPTSTSVPNSGGLYLPAFFGANYDNAEPEINPVYMVIREVEGLSTPGLTLLMTPGTTDPPGGADSTTGSIFQIAYGAAAYYTL